MKKPRWCNSNWAKKPDLDFKVFALQFCRLSAVLKLTFFQFVLFSVYCSNLREKCNIDMSLERKGASFSFWNLEKNQITRNITVRECIFPYPGMGFIYIRAQERNLLAFSLIGRIFVSKLRKCFTSAHPRRSHKLLM